jgi:hypothetical protein
VRGIAIDFEWAVFPDYRVEKGVRGPASAGLLCGAATLPKLVAIGEPFVTRPLDNFPELYLELAKARRTIDGQIKFAKRYGLLQDRNEEITMYWSNSVKNMRNLVAMVEKHETWKIEEGKYSPLELRESFSFRFELNAETNSINSRVVPKSLYVALAYQCLSHAADGAQIRVCKSCSALFEAGGASGRRVHAEFCSDKCRYQFHHRNRSKKQ